MPMIALLVAALLAAAFPGFDTRASAPQAATGLQVDYERSTIVAKLKKGGLLRFLGHEHGVLAEGWSAEVVFDPRDAASSRISVEIEAARLIIDSAAARAAAGVDPDGPDADEVADIRAKMLSDEQLDAAAFPTIRFTSRRLRIDDDELRIDGDLTLHGVRRPVSAEAELSREGDGYVVRGSFEIKHRDFDIEPVSIGGVVKVANDIEVMFEIYAAPASPARRR